MTLRLYAHTLELKHAFTLARSTRTTTPIMLVELERDGIVGYGEASMPPYLGETHETARAFLSRVDLTPFDDLFQLEEILTWIDKLQPGQHAAKAAVDMALHDWVGKAIGMSWHRLWGLCPDRAPATSFTLAIDTPQIVAERARDATDAHILKVKLGRDNDRAIVTAIRTVTDKPLRVDVNQGWESRDEALAMIEWLATQNVELVEQPLGKERREDLVWLRERSPLPIVGDEGVSRLADVRAAVGVYDAINVKLMKCTGLREAHRMIEVARALGLKIMLGCMTETSCAISAAAQLSPLADWVDLDGALLIGNDFFRGAVLRDGRMQIPLAPGIGATKIRDLR